MELTTPASLPSPAPASTNITVAGVGSDDAVTSNGQIVSDGLTYFFETLNFSIMSGTVSCVGSAANIINIVVFSKLGLGDSVNISLLGKCLQSLHNFGKCLFTSEYVNGGGVFCAHFKEYTVLCVP